MKFKITQEQGEDDVGGKFVIYFLVEIFFIKQLSPILRSKGKEKYIIN